MTLDEAIQGLRGYCKPWDEGGAGHNTLTAEIKVVLAEVKRLRRYPAAIKQLRDAQFTDRRVCDDIERIVHKAAEAEEGE